MPRASIDCKWWRKYGNCRQGDSCPFLHSDASSAYLKLAAKTGSVGSEHTPLREQSIYEGSMPPFLDTLSREVSPAWKMMARSHYNAFLSVVSCDEDPDCSTSYYASTLSTESNVLNVEPAKRRRVVEDADELPASIVAVGGSLTGSERIVMQEDGKRIHPVMPFLLDELVCKDWVGKPSQYGVDRIQAVALLAKNFRQCSNLTQKLCTSFKSFWLFGLFMGDMCVSAAAVKLVSVKEFAQIAFFATEENCRKKGFGKTFVRMIEARLFQTDFTHVFLYAAPAAREFWKSREYEPNVSRSKDPEIEKKMKGQIVEVVAENQEPLPVLWKTINNAEARHTERKESIGGDDDFDSDGGEGGG